MDFVTRNKTKRIKIGNTTIGGSDNVLIQSMCNIKTSNVEEVVKQINECSKLGADIMRVSVLDFDDVAAIKEIVPQITVPLVADIHFDYRFAIESVKNGASAIRINPGNIGGEEKVEEVVKVCKQYNVPIRIGVNSGSIDKNINNNTAKVNAKELVKSAEQMVKLIENLRTTNATIIKQMLKISTKTAIVISMVKSIFIMDFGPSKFTFGISDTLAANPCSSFKSKYPTSPCLYFLTKSLIDSIKNVNDLYVDEGEIIEAGQHLMIFAIRAAMPIGP